MKRLDYYEYMEAGFPDSDWEDYAAKHEFPMEQFIVHCFHWAPSVKHLCLRVQPGSGFVDTVKRL